MGQVGDGRTVLGGPCHPTFITPNNGTKRIQVTWLIYLTAIALIVTKWFDCITTLRSVNASTETNAFAARMMRRFGVPRTVWAVFALVLGIVLLSTYITLRTDSLFLQVGYLALGLPIAAIQAAVAHTNATGRWSVITRAVLRIHQR